MHSKRLANDYATLAENGMLIGRKVRTTTDVQGTIVGYAWIGGLPGSETAYMVVCVEYPAGDDTRVDLFSYAGLTLV